MARHFREPDLHDLLRDPLTEILMARDGISRDAMMSLLTWAAAQRTAGAPILPPGEAGAR
jgi:hypothetical protein